LTSGFIKLRFTYLWHSYLTRWYRLYSHIFLRHSVYRIPLDRWYDWPVDMTFYLLDIFCVTDLADILMNGYKSMRRLSLEELELAQDLFKNNIDLGQVFIWEKSRPIKKGLYHAFVSFNTIQSVKTLRLPIMMHELVHVWQYQRYGSVYIYRALKAQNSKAGYDYGGCDQLIKCLGNGHLLTSFNFEQQAEIVEDYVRINLTQRGLNLDLAIYQAFIDQLDYHTDLA